MRFGKVVLLGLGRIGLPTAACLAEAGLEVLGVDINEDRLREIREGLLDRREPGLAEAVSRSLASGRLSLSTTPRAADVFLLCLPTPLSSENTCDLSYLKAGVDSIAGLLEPGNLVIVESTVPVHTTRDFVLPRLRSLKVDVDSIMVAYAPERIISGAMMEEIRRDDRVIGGITPEAAKAARDLYKTFVKGRMFLTDSSTAELVKLIENTYRDVNIAFANEVALFCDRHGINAWEAIALANRHPRVNIHTPGPGVGGHCIPIVPHFLAQVTRHSRMISAAREVNDSMPRYVSNMVSRAVIGLEKPTVALMGVAYKANSTDSINSPALQILEFLKRERLRVVMCDPLVERTAFPLVEVEEAMRSDCLVFLVAHDIFQDISPAPPHKGWGIVIDLANCLDLDAWASEGWQVQGFARGA